MNNLRKMDSFKALRPPQLDDDDETEETPATAEWEDDPTSPGGPAKNAAFQNFSEPDPTTLAEEPEVEPEAAAEAADEEPVDQAVPEIETAAYHQDYSNQPSNFDDDEDTAAPSEEPAAHHHEEVAEAHHHEEQAEASHHEEEVHHHEEAVHHEETVHHEEAVHHEEETVHHHEEEAAAAPEPASEPVPVEPTPEETPAVSSSIQSNISVSEEDERLALENSKNRSRPSRRFNDTPASTTSTTSSAAAPVAAASAVAAAAVVADAPKAEPKKWKVETNYVRAGMRSTKAVSASSSASTTSSGRGFQGLSSSSSPAPSTSSAPSVSRYSSSSSAAAVTAAPVAVAAAPAPVVVAATAVPVAKAAPLSPSSSSSPRPGAGAGRPRMQRFRTAQPAASEAVAASTSTGSGGSDAESIVRRIVAADEDVTWAIFEYKKQLEVVHSGPGTVDDLRKHLDQNGAYFGYLRTTVGAEQRNKFVLIRWVGDRITPMARARMLDSEAQVKKIIKIYHIEIPTSTLDELVVAKVAARLAKAGGANYDKNQNVAGATDDSTQFTSYKGQSKDFFSSIERSGNVRSVEYVRHALPKTTPVDLSSRQMTVGASINQKNLVLDVPGVDNKGRSGQE